MHRLLLRSQRLLVALQRFTEPLQLIKHRALVQVSDGHRVIRRDSSVVARNCFFQPFQLLQRRAFLYQRLGVVRRQFQRLFKANQSFLRFRGVQESLSSLQD